MEAALRQQLLALHGNDRVLSAAPSIGCSGVALRRLWSGWRKPLVVVTPETVVRWHRTGF